MAAPIYRNRQEAGQRLAALLEEYRGRDDVTVLALPRGGVPVALEVARALGAPLDVYLVRKLGVPGHEELAVGAIAPGGVRVLNAEVVRQMGVSEAAIEQVAAREARELERRERLYRGDRPRPDVRGRTVILIDDGLATGASMRAAVSALRLEGPRAIVVAVPTAAPDVCQAFEALVEKIVCAATPFPFYAVGASYAEFGQISDEEVRALLAQAAPPRSENPRTAGV